MAKAAAQPISTLGYALLGLVHHQPRAGYALHKVFTTTPMGHYSGSPGAIYPALRALERTGMVRGKVQRGGTLRPKRVFSATKKGLVALKRWLLHPVSRADVIWRLDELMLRFAFMDQMVSRPETLRFLESFRNEIESYIASLKAHRTATASTMSLHGRLAFKNGIDGYQAQARWARYASKVLRAHARARRSTRTRKGTEP